MFLCLSTRHWLLSHCTSNIMPAVGKGTHSWTVKRFQLRNRNLKIDGIRDIWIVKVVITQLCPTLSDSMSCSPPGSSARGIFQARILEWVAIPVSGGSSRPSGRAWSSALQADSLPIDPPGKPLVGVCNCRSIYRKHELTVSPWTNSWLLWAVAFSLGWYLPSGFGIRMKEIWPYEHLTWCPALGRRTVNGHCYCWQLKIKSFNFLLKHLALKRSGQECTWSHTAWVPALALTASWLCGVG